MFIFDIPLWLSGLLLVVLFAAYALLAMAVIRRRVLPRMRFGEHDAEYASMIVHSVIGFYGLVTALIAVSVWSRHSSVMETAGLEATSVGSLWRDISGYPSPIREELRDMLRGYTKYTIDTAWVAQRNGVIPYAGVLKIDRFQEKLFAFEPATENQRLLHAEALRAYNLMIQFRRQRLETTGKGLPGVLWFLVIGGAMIILLLVMFYRVENIRLQTFLVFCLSTFMAMVIFVILALDQPYRGELGVKPAALQLIYDHLMNH